MVVPGGHSIGVVLRSSGLLITGLAPVETVDGRHVWPARNADLEAGDVIISVGDQKIGTKEEFALIIDRAGREGRWVDILVEKADGSAVRRTLMPVRHRNGGFQIGLLVKDALAGVGTPFTRKRASHGPRSHDLRGRLLARIHERGLIVRATVTVNPSRKGLPGEVLGTFLEGHDVIGTILQNGECGISGVLSEPLDNGHYPEPIPLGLQGRLRRGPAEVLTTIEGTSIERFSVEIEQIFTGSCFYPKALSRLPTRGFCLSPAESFMGERSPIIQDGYLGSHTHVLVNDPARDTVPAEWMARNAYGLSGTELQRPGGSTLAPGCVRQPVDEVDTPSTS